MIIDRDVTDVIQITLATQILALVLISENSRFDGNELILIGLTLTIIITFFHVILLQLKIITSKISKGFSYSTIVTSLLTITGYFDYKLVETEGSWDKIGLSYKILFSGSLILLFLTSLVFLFSEQAKSDGKIK